MDQIVKILRELLPYTSEVSSQLFYFLLAAILVTVLHILFPRIRIIKYIPGISLVILALLKIIFNGESSILRTNVNDIETAVICGAVGIVSIIFANLIGIMYGKNRKIRKKRRPADRVKRNSESTEDKAVIVDENK